MKTTEKKKERIKEILDMFAFYVFHIEYGMGGWEYYRNEINVDIEDDYPKSREDFIKLLIDL